jgi:serine phosphatase RsbU (regulator of sigma subunit)
MPRLDVQVAVAKTSKSTTGESGDTVEIVERPRGGLSLVMADGQRSGKAAKSISNIVVRKAIALLSEGVRDGAVARAAHDYLRTMRGGKVLATLNIVSIDLQTETVVISRNSHCPTVVCIGGKFQVLDDPSEPVGIRTWTKPVIAEIPIAPNMYIIVFTDGVLHAGRSRGQPLDVLELIHKLLAVSEQTPVAAQALADTILEKAVDSDRGRPGDDISVVAVSMLPAAPDADTVRRMSVCFPIRIKRVSQDG